MSTEARLLTVYNYLYIRKVLAHGEWIRLLAQRLHDTQKTIRELITSELGEPAPYTRDGPQTQEVHPVHLAASPRRPDGAGEAAAHDDADLQATLQNLRPLD